MTSQPRLLKQALFAIGRRIVTDVRMFRASEGLRGASDNPNRESIYPEAARMVPLFFHALFDAVYLMSDRALLVVMHAVSTSVHAVLATPTLQQPLSNLRRYRAVV
jgi:hypothetical protein